VTADELVGAGQGLFEGAGGCIACHAEGTGARGPNLLTDYQGEGTIGQRCGDRVSGLDCKAYLYDSLTQPVDFLVDDYPPIMPALNRTMNPQQVWAVVAFLQSQGGEVTVTGADIPSDDAAGGADEGGAAGGGMGLPGVAGADPVEILNQECVLCHQLDGGGVPLGPPLDGVGGRLSSDQIRQSILEPSASASEGYQELISAMPPTFGDRFTAAQLESVVSYLSSLE
jgi:mono/diheme cytochrome c family protein